MPLSYRPLFLLEANTASIFEIKRLDVQSDNQADVYFWLYFDKASRQLSHLTFVSMNADGAEQQREFAQGQLQFSDAEGTYAPLPGTQPLRLRRLIPPTLPATVDAALQVLFGQAGAVR
jgi:hypothetical protein